MIIKGNAEIQTQGYVFEGNTVEIKVTASITEGTITKIEAPEGVILKKDTSATEKLYTVSKNGKYIFKIAGDNGKTRKITAKVENILNKPQIKISEITENSFKINVENDYPEGAITEYKYYVDGTLKQQGTTETSYTVTGLEEDTEYNNIKVVAYIKNMNIESNVEKATTEIKDSISYSWDEIAKIAKAISNDTSITDDSEIATVTIDGEEKTLKVGQMKKLDGKRVRILGFNHDELAEPNTAYDSTTLTKKAGISFEYVDFLISACMNSSNTNKGGWKDTELREKLNVTTYNSLSIKNIIKKVKKDYIPTYNVASTETSEDYLWLLSCGEIWTNGYSDSNSRGYAIVSEGKQYKLYKIHLSSLYYGVTVSITRKPNANSSDVWWLRSSGYTSENFCTVHSPGYGHSNVAIGSYGVTPGFAI